MSKRRIFACALLLIQVLLGCGEERSTSSLAAREVATRYPIVLHHGLFGFDRILVLDYFYDVKATLEREGHVVRTMRVSPVNSMEVRTQQLAEQIDAVLDETGAGKVNIIAHSMGGIDARHLISVLGYGDRVASVITIGTPHGGSRVADLARSLTERKGRRMVAALDRLFLGGSQHRAGLTSMGDIDLQAALWSLSEKHLRSAEFLEAHRDDPRVVYESFAGHSNMTGLGAADRVHPLLVLPYTYLKSVSGDNDGLVSVESARHGLDRGTIPADHLNMIGQLFGNTSRGFDHREFYARLATNLSARGF
jgi:triacylglycerol lipase